jgi:hypothetical protein
VISKDELIKRLDVVNKVIVALTKTKDGTLKQRQTLMIKAYSYKGIFEGMLKTKEIQEKEDKENDS